MNSVYYAHPMSTYGTKVESDDLEALNTRFPKVINPNTTAFQEAAQRQKAAGQSPMRPFLEAIQSVDVVAYRPFPNGKIGAGIANEVLEAVLRGKTILRLPECQPIGFSTDDILSVAETRDAIKTYRQADAARA